MPKIEDDHTSLSLTRSVMNFGLRVGFLNMYNTYYIDDGQSIGNAIISRNKHDVLPHRVEVLDEPDSDAEEERIKRVNTPCGRYMDCIRKAGQLKIPFVCIFPEGEVFLYLFYIAMQGMELGMQIGGRDEDDDEGYHQRAPGRTDLEKNDPLVTIYYCNFPPAIDLAYADSVIHSILDH